MTRARELADLLTGGQTISTDDNTAQLTVKSTDADANSGPLLVLTRDSGSPADGDNAGLIQFKFDNDAGDDFVSAAQISAKANDVSDGSEDGELEILTIIGGSSRSRVEMLPGETVFNEDSQDVDFRVESNGNANMLFVDAGNDLVGIGQGTPDAELHIGDGGGSSDNTRLRLTGGTSGQSTIQFGDTDSANIGQLQYDHSSNFLAVRINASERMRIDSSGRLFMGVTSNTTGGESFTVDAADGFRLFCSRGSTAAREQIIFFNPNGDVGSIDTSGTSTSYNTSSDHRLKQGVEDMTGAIDRVKALAPKRFQFIADADTTLDGFLAHEAQTVVPEAVTGSKDEVDDDGNAVMQGIDQSKLVPVLTAALKEAIVKIETLETKVAALEAE